MPGKEWIRGIVESLSQQGYFLIMIDDAQVVGVGHGTGEGGGIADLEYAADAKRGGDVRGEGEFEFAVAIEFDGRVAQRGVLEYQLAALPRGDFVERRLIDEIGGIL